MLRTGRLGRVAGLSLLLAAALVLVASSAIALGSPGRYIVVLKDRVGHPKAVAAKQAHRYEAETTYVYRSALTGYAATIPAGQVDSVRADDQVAYVERDRTVSALAQTLPWGIDRIGADTSSTLAGNGSGAIGNVRAYVIDTGIYRSHPDLTSSITSTSRVARTTTATAMGPTWPGPWRRGTTRATSSGHRRAPP